MNKRRLVFLPLSAMLLTSCGQTIDWNNNIEKYIFTMPFHQDFNILQLTDIHWNVNSSTASSKIYISKLLDQVDKHIKEKQGTNKKIDLVELTGDQFMLSNTYHVRTFIEFFETQATKYDFKYTVIWGNHDHHGLYNPTWLAKKFNEAKHCYYKELDDNLYGRSNFVINLNEGVDGTGATKWQIANLDSGASFSESPLSVFRNYDYIRDDQIKWLEKVNKDAGNNIPTIAYYHIPQQNNQLLWDAIHNDGATYKHNFFKLEGFGDAGKEEYHSNLYEYVKTHNINLKASFMGHAHNVDWTVDYDGIVIGLGVKTGAELYYAHIDPNDPNPDLQEGLAKVRASADGEINEKFDLIGASLVTLKNADNFDLEHVYYNDREGANDFVRWAKW